jgi:hypothetical protein
LSTEVLDVSDTIDGVFGIDQSLDHRLLDDSVTRITFESHDIRESTSLPLGAAVSNEPLLGDLKKFASPFGGTPHIVSQSQHRYCSLSVNEFSSNLLRWKSAGRVFSSAGGSSPSGSYSPNQLKRM